MTIVSEKGRISVKCERCQKDIPLQHGFNTSSLVLKTRMNRGIILSPLCDECATDITSIINRWLNKEEDKECSK